ncbi:hypothetical protein KUV62_20650 [Salipiger bermudensis]|uniref:hypothetical protein n=1 Tax=Salipiger bermudensis TaxID=344736 RepID=UPI001C99F2AE|nr:hypothetical protein [Salipiger bermudensis]MBY6006345.1 hypothetical protein [Salipiger bermudensis]
MTGQIFTACLAALCGLGMAAGSAVAADPTLTTPAAQAAPAPDAPVQLALTFGDPVPLTDGEKAEIRFLLPGADPEAFPPETWGQVRAVLLSRDLKVEKRNKLKSILGRAG